MNSDSLDNLSLKYHRFTRSGNQVAIYTGIGKFEFVAKTQFLSFHIITFQIKMMIKRSLNSEYQEQYGINTFFFLLLYLFLNF